MQYSKVPNTMVRLNNCEVWESDFFFNMQQMRRVLTKKEESENYLMVQEV